MLELDEPTLGRISPSESATVEADEVLTDGLQETPGPEGDRNLESPLRRSGSFAAAGLIAAALLIGLGRLVQLSLLDHAHFLALAEKSRTSVDWFSASRGLILDRMLKPLVRNEAASSLVVIPNMLPKRQPDLEALAVRLAGLLKVQPAALFEQFKSADLLSSKPIVVASDLDEAQALFLGATFANDPVVHIEATLRRKYLAGQAFSHALGYMGRVTEADMRGDTADYLPTDSVGRTGLEASYDGLLRGGRGRRDYLIRANGERIRVISAIQSTAGMAIISTIDSGLEAVLAAALENELKKIGRSAGATVALDPRNGEVLALVSFPQFDNNVFSKTISETTYRALVDNPGRPLFNRAISGQYPPGSAIKPVVATAALNERIIDPARQIFVTGSISVPSVYDPKVVYTFKDWRPQGWVDMRRALAVSSNVYFYTMGGGFGDIQGLGIDRLVKYFELFGLGARLGIDIPSESVGFVPTPAWKEAAQNQAWYIGDTYHVSIGQGDLQVTPLQMAAYTMAIANGGTIYQPHLVKATVAADGVQTKQSPQTVGAIGIDENAFKVVRQGMRQAVTDGSARLLNALPMPVAGKTGTAQPGGDQAPHGWFTGFAPYTDPRLVLTILIENGGEGSSVAVPVAKEVFAWYAANRL